MWRISVSTFVPKEEELDERSMFLIWVRVEVGIVV